MTANDIKIELGAVQETLILPLWARAQESSKADPLVKDSLAKEIISRIDYDFSEIEKGQTANHQLIWPIRAYKFDLCIRKFIEHNENTTVVNIGAGLDTTFSRIDNGSLMWINLDLPDVIALRNQLVPNTEREKTIAKSVFDLTWIEDIAGFKKDRPLLFMAAGVLCYFTAGENKSLFLKLADAFPAAHLVFDAMSRFALKATNRTIMKGSGMDAAARLNWHLNRASTLKKWVGSLEIIEECSMFSGIQPRKEWDNRMVRDYRLMKFLQIQNMYKLIHVQFG